MVFWAVACLEVVSPAVGLRDCGLQAVLALNRRVARGEWVVWVIGSQATGSRESWLRAIAQQVPGSRVMPALNRRVEWEEWVVRGRRFRRLSAVLQGWPHRHRRELPAASRHRADPQLADDQHADETACESVYHFCI